MVREGGRERPTFKRKRRHN
uniref:Uncharacterized protein n=1 Tax=Anguilla anguilla TaxID=7936 RepID=A0A0E9R737_ANGAN